MLFRSFGGTTFAGGIVAVGVSDSSSNGDFDGWIVRLDGSGKSLWQKTLGGPYNDRFAAAAPLATDFSTVGRSRPARYPYNNASHTPIMFDAIRV